MSEHAAPHGADHGGHGHSGGESTIGKYLKAFLNPFAGEKRAHILRESESAGPKAPEISGITNFVKKGVALSVLGIKTVIKAPFKLTNEIVTTALSLPLNLGKWALDILRLPLSKANQAIEAIRKGTHNQIDKIDNLSLKGLFKSSGGSHGGDHGHAAAEHH